MENVQTYVGELPQEYEGEILEILSACDREFYPPLTSRVSPYQTALQGDSSTAETPIAYFQALRKQTFILLIGEGQVCAFLSFKEKIEEREFYVSTLCVKPIFRGKGFLHLLYNLLDETALAKGVKAVTTRTWSTNEAQLKTLANHGYEISKVIENDRPNGVGTVYFTKLLHA